MKNLDLDDRVTNLRRARQLCLPVSKDNQQVPPDVLHVVQWVDGGIPPDTHHQVRK